MTITLSDMVDAIERQLGRTGYCGIERDHEGTVTCLDAMVERDRVKGEKWPFRTDLKGCLNTARFLVDGEKCCRECLPEMVELHLMLGASAHVRDMAPGN